MLKPGPAAESFAPPGSIGCEVALGVGLLVHAQGEGAHVDQESFLVDVRAGKHTCYDRLVLEFRGPVNGYTIKYVNQVHQEGSGKPVPLAGRAKLQVTSSLPPTTRPGTPPTPPPTLRTSST
jgi:hypothetical protein